MRVPILLAAALAACSASAIDTHVGNGEVHDSFDSDAEGGSSGGNAGTANGAAAIAPSCPEEPDGAHDPRRGKPLCGQPPAPQCNAPPGAVCSMMMPAHRTYPNCAALIRDNATLVHFGRCDGPPRPEPQRVAIAFDVKSFHQCVARVSHAKRLKPTMAPWIQADGKPMKARDFCKRLFNPPVESQVFDATTDETADADDEDRGDGVGGGE